MFAQNYKTERWNQAFWLAVNLDILSIYQKHYHNITLETFPWYQQQLGSQEQHSLFQIASGKFWRDLNMVKWMNGLKIACLKKNQEKDRPFMAQRTWMGTPFLVGAQSN